MTAWPIQRDSETANTSMFFSCIVLRTGVSGRLCGLSGPNVCTFQQAIPIAFVMKQQDCFMLLLGFTSLRF